MGQESSSAWESQHFTDRETFEITLKQLPKFGCSSETTEEVKKTKQNTDQTDQFSTSVEKTENKPVFVPVAVPVARWRSLKGWELRPAPGAFSLMQWRAAPSTPLP